MIPGKIAMASYLKFNRVIPSSKSYDMKKGKFNAGILSVAAGVLMMVHGIGRRVPFWLPLAMTWVGSGAMFGWGLWLMINVLGQTALLRGAESMALVHLAGLLRLVVGLVMGLLTVFLLAERQQRIHDA